MQLTNGAITKSAAPPPPAALANQLAAQELIKQLFFCKFPESGFGLL